LEIQGLDIQDKVEEIEPLNRLLREQDKSKDDHIAMLADHSW
jgi:hypothetical protein